MKFLKFKITQNFKFSYPNTNKIWTERDPRHKMTLKLWKNNQKLSLSHPFWQFKPSQNIILHLGCTIIFIGFALIMKVFIPRPPPFLFFLHLFHHKQTFQLFHFLSLFHFICHSFNTTKLTLREKIEFKEWKKYKI